MWPKKKKISVEAVKWRFVVLCVLPSGVLNVPEHQSDSHAYLLFSFSSRPEWRGEEKEMNPEKCQPHNSLLRQWPELQQTCHTFTTCRGQPLFLWALIRHREGGYDSVTGLLSGTNRGAKLSSINANKWTHVHCWRCRQRNTSNPSDKSENSAWSFFFIQTLPRALSQLGTLNVAYLPHEDNI